MLSHALSSTLLILVPTVMSFKKWLRETSTVNKIGLGIAALGILQFLFFLGLDWVGVIDVGNGVGLGMLMWLCVALGGLVLGVGILINVVKWILKKIG